MKTIIRLSLLVFIFQMMFSPFSSVPFEVKAEDTPSNGDLKLELVSPSRTKDENGAMTFPRGYKLAPSMKMLSYDAGTSTFVHEPVGTKWDTIEVVIAEGETITDIATSPAVGTAVPAPLGTIEPNLYKLTAGYPLTRAGTYTVQARAKKEETIVATSEARTIEVKRYAKNKGLVFDFEAPDSEDMLIFNSIFPPLNDANYTIAPVDLPTGTDHPAFLGNRSLYYGGSAAATKPIEFINNKGICIPTETPNTSVIINPGQRLCIEYDIMFEVNPRQIAPFFMAAGTSWGLAQGASSFLVFGTSSRSTDIFLSFPGLDSDTNVTSSSGNAGKYVGNVGNITLETWYRVRYELNMVDKVLDVYIDDGTGNKRILAQQEFTPMPAYDETGNGIKRFRIQLNGSNTEQSLYIDNYKISYYTESTEPEVFEIEGTPSLVEAGDGSKVTGSIVFKNTTGEKEEAFVAVGLYNNNQLVDVSTTGVAEIPADTESYPITLNATLDPLKEYTSAKMFIWDSGFKPFAVDVSPLDLTAEPPSGGE